MLQTLLKIIKEVEFVDDSKFSRQASKSSLLKLLRTYSREVEKWRKRILIWQSNIRLTENIEESIRASFEGSKNQVS